MVVDAGTALSVAVTETMDEPAAMGVPEKTPEVVMVNPTGRLPLLMLNVTRPVPPTEVTDEEKLAPTCPLSME